MKIYSITLPRIFRLILCPATLQWTSMFLINIPSEFGLYTVWISPDSPGLMGRFFHFTAVQSHDGTTL